MTAAEDTLEPHLDNLNEDRDAALRQEQEAAAVDPPAVRTFHAKIADFVIFFGKNTLHPQLDTALNRAYPMSVDFEDLLLDDNTNWKDSANVLDDIRRFIIDTIATNASRTDDTSIIGPLINKCILSFEQSHAGNIKPIRKTKDIDSALNRLALRNTNAVPNSLTFNIIIGTSVWFVDTRVQLDVLDFSIFSNTGFPLGVPDLPAGHAPPRPAGGIDPDIIALIEQLDTNAKTYAAAQKPAYSAQISVHPFIPANFPQDVRERVRNQRQDYHYPTLNELQPFQIGATRMNYYSDPAHIGTSFVSLDGSYHILEDRGPSSEKSFRLTVNKCTGNSNYDIFTWYNTFCDHCIRFGIYCHPYACFSKRCTHPRGFTLGNASNDDLSATFDTKITNASRLLWDTLKIAFSDNTNLYRIVELHDGKGYDAIHSIISANHPLIISDPTRLCSVRPIQNQMSLAEYWKCYNHFLMIRALVENNPFNITYSSERKHFIHGCKHNEYIESEMRREEYIPALQYKFEPQNLTNTINNYLLLSNSPTQTAARPAMSYQRRRQYRPYDPSSPRDNTRQPYGSSTRDSSRASYPSKPIQQLGFLEDTPDLHENDFPDESIFNVEGHDIHTQDIDYAYCAAVNQIKANPSAANTPCLVCEVVLGAPPKDNHRFDQCKILANHPLLQKNFINMCSTMRRTRKALTSKSINEVQTHDTTDDTAPDLKSDSELEQHSPPDFRTGGY